MATAQSQAQEHAATAFRILDLPAELREYILELVFFTSDNNYFRLPNPSSWIDTGYYKPPPLLQVCSRIREEYGTLYYRQTAFMFDSWKGCAAWLESVGPQFRDQIRLLSYCTGVEGDETFTGMTTAEQRWGEMRWCFGLRGFDVSGMLRVCDNRQSHGTDDCHIWVVPSEKKAEQT